MKKLIRNITIPLMVIAYFIIRYPLFNLHGMKQFPILLLFIAAIVSYIFFVLNQQIIPLFLALGYIFGFIFGYIFQSDYVGPGNAMYNNLWQIWIITMVIFFVIGIVVTLIKIKRE